MKTMANTAAALKSHALVRPARADDFDAIMAVNRWVYDGADYLPAMYHEYLKNPQIDCFVLELVGEVVSDLKLWYCTNVFHIVFWSTSFMLICNQETQQNIRIFDQFSTLRSRRWNFSIWERMAHLSFLANAIAAIMGSCIARSYGFNGCVLPR